MLFRSIYAYIRRRRTGVQATTAVRQRFGVRAAHGPRCACGWNLDLEFRRVGEGEGSGKMGWLVMVEKERWRGGEVGEVVLWGEFMGWDDGDGDESYPCTYIHVLRVVLVQFVPFSHPAS